MSGAIYEYGKLEHKDLYVKTTKNIMNHIGKKFNFNQDILRSLDAKKIIDLEKPTPPNALYDPEVVTPLSEEIVRQNEINRWTSRKDTLEKNIYKAYTLVWGQYSDGRKSKLEILNEYAIIHKDFNIF